MINIKTPNRETCTYILRYNNSKAYKVGVRSMGHQEGYVNLIYEILNPSAISTAEYNNNPQQHNS